MTQKAQSTGQIGETTNPFESVQQQIDATCERMHINETVHLRLRECERELTVHFPVKMDNGQVKIFTGYRVQHNNARGPFKGVSGFTPMRQ